jgi:hypothetical protein
LSWMKQMRCSQEVSSLRSRKFSSSCQVTSRLPFSQLLCQQTS